MSILRQIFDTLQEYYEAKDDYPWWPENPIEVILGAVLVQGSTWNNVAKVLQQFQANDLLDFHKIVRLTDEELITLIRSVGFQTKKAPRIKALAQLIQDQSGGDLEHYFARDADTIRRELLSISGIGHGTADNILLYAGQVPIYMVDPFSTRILTRHGIAPLHTNETKMQELIHSELSPDEEPHGVKLFQKMQEYLVRLGRECCDKSRPDCWCCPLSIYLPEGGAIGIEAKRLSDANKDRNNKKTIEKGRPGNSEQTAPPIKPVEPVELNETERKIVETIGEGPIPIDDVVIQVQLPVHIVRATIAVLQMKRVVCQVEGNQVQRSR